jgi:hypothetical protein
MPGINPTAIGAAALAAFVVCTVWYIVFAKHRRELSEAAAGATRRPPPLKIAGELIRNILLAGALAYVLVHTGVTGAAGTMRLGLILWIGFPVVLLTGSAMWEDVPWKLAAIHAGDWLVKLLVMIVIVDLWR